MQRQPLVYPTALSDRALQDIAAALGITTMQVEKLLSAGVSEAKSREELQSVTSLANREHFRKTYIGPLVAAGWLVLTIPDKPQSRLQKYQLTEKGLAWLAARTK